MYNNYKSIFSSFLSFEGFVKDKISILTSVYAYLLLSKKQKTKFYQHILPQLLFCQFFLFIYFLKINNKLPNDYFLFYLMINYILLK